MTAIVDLSAAIPVVETALLRLQGELSDYGFIIIAIHRPSAEEEESANSVVLSGLVRSTVPPEIAGAAMRVFLDEMKKSTSSGPPAAQG